MNRGVASAHLVNAGKITKIPMFVGFDALKRRVRATTSPFVPLLP